LKLSWLEDNSSVKKLHEVKMEDKNQFTKEEIFSQTKAWAGALREVESKKKALAEFDLENYDQVLFTGCGSTYYLSIAAASLFQSQTGVMCKAVPGGEILMNPDTVYKGSNNLLFAISRSGSTTETVYAVEQFRKDKGGKVICITNYSDQPLLKLADLGFSIEEGQEQSIAQTRSFCSMYVAATAIAMLLSGNDALFNEMKKLPEIGKALMDKYHDFAKQIGEKVDFDRFYFLGSGFRYGLACEANLKMKEMTLTHTEPFYFLEFRHGPKSMVTNKTVVVGMLSESGREYEEKVLDEMKGIGATIFSIGEKNADISFESDLPEVIRNILYLPLLQVMAYYRSLKKGLNPDKPRNLSTVVFLD